MMSFFKQSSQQRSFIKVINILLLLLWFLFIGKLVLSRQISPFSFTPDEMCEFSSVCEVMCNDLGYPTVLAGQLVPTMFHICVDDLCFCSTQPDDQTNFPWTQGRAISKYNCDTMLPAEEGEQYNYEECLTLCSNDDQMSPTDDSTDQADTDLIFIIVVNGDCYCDAIPEFTAGFVEVPDETEEGIVESDGEWPEYNPRDYMESDQDEEHGVVQDDEPVIGKGKGKQVYYSPPPPPRTVDSGKHVYHDDDPLIGSSKDTKRVKYTNPDNYDKHMEDNESQSQQQNPVSDDYENES